MINKRRFVIASILLLMAASVQAQEMTSATDGSTSQPAPVAYFDSQTVEAAFAKGAPLIGEQETMMHQGRNYMVHASRRDKPGVAEIHTWDTDVIYVLEGTATLVTGGKAVEPKEIAPGEIRGTVIEGGESRRIGKGDVIVIPNGVPHWFKEVGSAPVLYFVVKPRAETEARP